MAIIVAGLHMGSVHAAGLNDRSRAAGETLGLPLDSLFQPGVRHDARRSDANPYLPGPFDPAASASKRPARPDDPPRGSALGGRRKQP